MVEQVPFPGQGPGLTGLQDVLRGMRSAFPICTGPSKSNSPTANACLPGLYGPERITGNSSASRQPDEAVTVWGMVIDRLVDGRIKDTRILMDTLGLMMQLGAVPG